MSLDELLLRQAGVVSRAQAHGVGLGTRAVDHRVRTRRWLPLHPRVYLVAGRAGPPAEVRVRAALLWAGEGAVLCGAAAAWWLGLLAGPPAALRVALPAGRAHRARTGVVAFPRPLAPADRAEHRGVAVTAPARTVLDTAVELGAAGPAWQAWLLRSGSGGGREVSGREVISVGDHDVIPVTYARGSSSGRTGAGARRTSELHRPGPR